MIQKKVRTAVPVNDEWVTRLQNATTTELEKWRGDIDSELQKREAKERADAKRKILELAGTHGIDLSELSNKAIGDAKYRNPDNPFEAWSGRGRKPKWVKEWLDKGASLDELVIR